MESYIQISKLNDFVFCPMSLYFHSFYENYNQKTYHQKAQAVFEIKNSQRILENIKAEIEHNFKKRFTNNDSVIIYGICEACEKKIVRYGYPVQEEKSVVFFG